MMKFRLFYGFVFLMLFACNNTPTEVVVPQDPKMQLRGEIEAKEKIFNPSNMLESDYLDIIRSYKTYATTYLDDTMSAEYAWKAAVASEKINKPENYISYCEIIINNFPKSRWAPHAAFGRAKAIYKKTEDKVGYSGRLNEVLSAYADSPVFKEVQIELDKLE